MLLIAPQRLIYLWSACAFMIKICIQYIRWGLQFPRKSQTPGSAISSGLRFIATPVQTCNSVHSLWLYNAAGNCKVTMSDFTIELTGPFPILLMLSAWLGNDKYQFDKSLVCLDQEPNSWSPACKVCALYRFGYHARWQKLVWDQNNIPVSIWLHTNCIKYFRRGQEYVKYGAAGFELVLLDILGFA